MAIIFPIEICIQTHLIDILNTWQYNGYNTKFKCHFLLEFIEGLIMIIDKVPTRSTPMFQRHEQVS